MTTLMTSILPILIVSSIVAVIWFIVKYLLDIKTALNNHSKQSDEIISLLKEQNHCNEPTRFD